MFLVDLPAFRTLRACLKSRVRGHVIVGVMPISTDFDKLYDNRKAAALLLGGLRPLFPNIRTVIAEAGHQREVLQLCSRAEDRGR